MSLQNTKISSVILLITTITVFVMFSSLYPLISSWCQEKWCLSHRFLLFSIRKTRQQCHVGHRGAEAENEKKIPFFRQKLAFTDGAASLLRERNWELCPNLENNGKILLGHFDKWKNQHLNLFQIMSWREWTFSLHGQLGVPEGVRFILLHSALYCCVCMAHCDAAGLFMSKNKYSEYIHTHLTRLCKVNTGAFVFQRCLLVRCLLAFCCLSRLSWPHRLCSAPRTIRFFRLLLSHLQLILSSAHHFVQFTAPSVLSHLLKLSCHKLFAYLLPCTKNHPWSYHFVLSGFMGICRAHITHIVHSYTLTI